jgi:hypothetical protein
VIRDIGREEVRVLPADSFFGRGGLTAWRGRSNRPGCFQVEVLFRQIFLCEFVCLDQRSVWVKFRVVLVPFARYSCLEFVAGYRRLDRPW